MNRTRRSTRPWRSLVMALVAGSCSLLALHVAAQMTASQIDQERASIDSERKQAEARRDAKLTACSRVFQTTKCTDEADGEWRSARRQLDARTAAVNQAERKMRAADRMAEIENNQASKKERDKQIQAEQRERAAQSASNQDQARQKEQAAAASAEAASKAARSLEDRRKAAATRCPPTLHMEGGRCVPNSKSASDQAAQFQSKAAEAAAHREAVLKRNAARDPAKAGKPLPVPSSIPGPGPASSPR